MPQNYKLVQVEAKARAKQEKMLKLGDSSFVIYVKEGARKGAANRRIIGIISKIFKVPKSRISIKSGNKYHKKILKIEY